jgi:predicted nuclease of restriction endonuclease-like (RecB) superfamily
LSAYLNNKFKRGFSVANIKNARQFYLVYAKQIEPNISGGLTGSNLPSRQSIISELTNKNNAEIRQSFISEFGNIFKLSWTHYLVLMRIANDDERKFYEIEAFNEQWTVDKLSKEYHSSLYERLALSRNKDKVMELSRKGQIVEHSTDLLKSPLNLEFLGMAELPEYSENDLEKAIIDKMQNFLLELGKGFLFETRQKRFTFDNDHFFVDLVFYNRLLKCYVLIDLKTEKLKHQDLGQMQMYVNYFDRYVKTKNENPTIGILLCKKKGDSIVELTLPKNSNIYANEYSLYLPDKNLLQRKLAEWIAEFENEKK